MVALTQRQQSADEIIEAAIGQLRRNRHKIAEMLPCKVIMHLPPVSSRDPPCLEVHGKLKPGGPSLACE